MAVTHKRTSECSALFDGDEMSVSYQTACDEWVDARQTRFQWRHVTCRNCRRKAPPHWQRKWGLAA
jgi:hypothetical protein